MYDSDVFVIDLTGCVGSGEIINSISLALEIPSAGGKKINLKFKDTLLNQSQLLSIQGLISSHNSTLSNIETQSREMKELCETMGLGVTFVNNVQIDENKITIEEFKNPNSFNEAPVEVKTFSTPEEFYVKKEDFSFEKEVEEEDLPNGDINIEEAIHQSAKVAFENATNLDFMQEIIQEKEKEENFEINNEENSAPAFEVENIEEQASKNEDDRQFIGVYKKANEEEKETYEEIDFYAPPTDEPVVIDSTQTIYVNQTLRSGQILEYDGNVVIIGDCHPGSEVKASGDITVWGVLGSIAHAGIKGNKEAKIRALKMNAVQLRIANCYSRRPDGTNIPYIVKSSTCIPEEARVVDDSIVLYKIN